MSPAFIGPDPAKSVFQVHGVDIHGKVVVTKRSALSFSNRMTIGNYNIVLGTTSYLALETMAGIAASDEAALAALTTT
jgi:hypothetical protein